MMTFFISRNIYRLLKLERIYMIYMSLSTLTKCKFLWQWIGGGNLHEDQCSTLPGIFMQRLKCHREYYLKFTFENFSKKVKIMGLWVIEKANIYSRKQKRKIKTETIEQIILSRYTRVLINIEVIYRLILEQDTFSCDQRKNNSRRSKINQLT